MRLLTVRTVLPEHRYDQRQITEAVAGTVRTDQRLLERLHSATQVSGRNLALPIEEPRLSCTASPDQGQDCRSGIVTRVGKRLEASK